MAHWRHIRGTIKECSTVASGDHLVIIGPYGNIWHDGTFPTAEAAEEYLRTFWRNVKDFDPGQFDPGQWRLACASVTIDAHEPSFPLPSAQVGRNPKGQDPQGLGAEHEHAVAEGDAPNSSQNKSGDSLA